MAPTNEVTEVIVVDIGYPEQPGQIFIDCTPPVLIFTLLIIEIILLF